MTFFKKIGAFILDFFGFKRNSKYVRNYLNDANIKSSMYMAFIIIALEIWMIIRQINKYISPQWNNYAEAGFSSRFDLVFTYTSLYYLFIVAAVAMMVFAIIYINKFKGKASFITNIVVGSICILWALLLIPEKKTGTNINKITIILLYSSLPIFGISIIGNSLYFKIKRKNNTILSIVLISCFALVCLLFGIKVGYSDFAHIADVTAPGFNIEKIKMITCFFTMVVFVGCLLIWKPYISIILLAGVFSLFQYFLESYPDRAFLDADKINYYTFLVSLTMIAISIYHQRIGEARKDELLIYEANFDHLTDINNVKSMINSVKYNHEENPMENINKIFLFMNIVNFRAINDQKGFEAGDKFLIETSKIIKNIFKGDLVARQSDDHFVVFTDESSFMPKLEELNKKLKEIADNLYVLLKVGGYRPKYRESPNRAIDKARYACNDIKNKYGVLYIEYDDKMDDALNKRQYIINHIEEAIEKEWVVAYYQPVVWSNNHELCGVEALARWIDPVYGFLSPGDFIPVLEDARLIHKLDEAIIKYVCKHMRAAIDDKKKVVPVSINFSRLDFELMDVENVLKKYIEEYNIDKNYLHVEITESALANNVDYLNSTILKLKQDGYSVWLDDFGSGYSSLNVLKDFVFDVIKIDMKFLSNFNQNEKTKDIIDCIIQLANRLGMKTLTEGVETVEQSKFLEQVGCGRLQGYLYGKPFKLEELESRISEGELTISDKII